MVVDFSATWCGPCKFIEPAFNDMSAKYSDVDFVKIDVDELSVRHLIFSISNKFSFTLLLMDDGVVGCDRMWRGSLRCRRCQHSCC